MTDTRRGDVENPWTIGVARQGNGPSEPDEKPRHHLTVSRESIHEFDDHFLTFEQASAQRIERLKVAGIKHAIMRRRGCHMITYTEPVSGDKITLTYVETEEQ